MKGFGVGGGFEGDRRVEGGGDRRVEGEGDKRVGVATI